VQGQRSFKPYSNERDSVKQAREKCKNPGSNSFDQKIPMKILSTVTHSYFLPNNFTILGSWQNLFPPKGSIVNAQQQKEKNGERKAKEAGRRESER